MNAISYDVLSVSSSGWTADCEPPELRTETSPALTLNERRTPNSWLMRRWRQAEAARSETAWAYFPADVADELDEGAPVTSDDVYWLLNVALGSEPVQAVAALRILGSLAGLADWRGRFFRVFLEALRSPFGRVRAEAAELIWGGGMVECLDALHAAANREQHDHVKRTMLQALELLRGKTGGRSGR